MLDYCDKCGWIWLNSYNQTDRKCDICENILKPVPDKYFENPDFKILLSKEMEHKLIEDLVKTSSNFDQYYFDNAINIKGRKDEAFNAKITHGKAVLEGKDKVNSYGVSCPYCKATNVKKISSSSRIVSTSLFGLGSKKIGKQWHCNKCKSDF